MELNEKLQVLSETAEYIIQMFSGNLGNEKIGLELRQLMADNVVVLSRMLETAENLSLFDPADPDVIRMKQDFFEVFNEGIIKNTAILNRIF